MRPFLKSGSQEHRKGHPEYVRFVRVLWLLNSQDEMIFNAGFYESARLILSGMKLVWTVKHRSIIETVDMNSNQNRYEQA